MSEIINGIRMWHMPQVLVHAFPNGLNGRKGGTKSDRCTHSQRRWITQRCSEQHASTDGAPVKASAAPHAAPSRAAHIPPGVSGLGVPPRHARPLLRRPLRVLLRWRLLLDDALGQGPVQVRAGQVAAGVSCAHRPRELSTSPVCACAHAHVHTQRWQGGKAGRPPTDAVRRGLVVPAGHGLHEAGEGGVALGDLHARLDAQLPQQLAVADQLLLCRVDQLLRSAA
jgi:hypothetical protein